MIEINLLPGSGKKKATRKQAVNVGAALAGMSGRFRDKFLIGGIAATLVAAGVVGLLWTRQTARATSLAAHREKALADSTRFVNFLRDRYRAESIRDSLLRQVNLIVNLDEDRFVWPHVLDEISRALPQYTWITNITFSGTPQGSTDVVLAPKTAPDTSKKKNARPKRMDTAIPKDPISIRMVGRTVDIQAATRLMRDLEASPFFSGIVLDKTEPVVDNGKEVAQFQLTFGYSRPDSTQLRRAPLALSVR